jgi:hypothetical protein
LTLFESETFTPSPFLKPPISEESETVSFGESLAASARWLSMVALTLGLVVIQLLIGGARMVFSFPGYFLIGLAACSWSFPGFPGGCARSAWVMPRQHRAIRWLCHGAGAWDRRLNILPEPISTWRPARFWFTGSRSFISVSARWRIGLVAALLVCAIAHVIVGAIQFTEANNFMLLPGIFVPIINGGPAAFTSVRIIWRVARDGGPDGPQHFLLGPSFGGARILLGYGAAVCLAGIALTGSRGGYLGTILGLTVFSIASLWVVRRVRPDRFGALCAVFIVGLRCCSAQRFRHVQERSPQRLASGRFTIPPTCGCSCGRRR